MDFRQFVRERIALPLGLPGMRLGLPPELSSSRRRPGLRRRGAFDRGELRKLGLAADARDRSGRRDDPGLQYAGGARSGRARRRRDHDRGRTRAFLPGRNAQSRQGRSADVEARGARGSAAPALGRLHRSDLGYKVNRALGVVVAGDDGWRTSAASARPTRRSAFGHGGAGGQIGWADPATGISLGYCTNGFDRNDIRQGRRGVAISSLAAVCAA